MRVRCALLLPLFVGCTAGDDIHDPVIASIVPERAGPGTSIVISGSYFCGQPEPHDPEEADPNDCENTGTVSFGAVPAIAAQYIDTMIVVEVPMLSPGPFDIQVSVIGRHSNLVGFTLE